jgi:D-glycero-D-manno-heptose 1,7-bisphosphate phosphatase
MTTTIFIDRDGVLNEKPPEHTYVTTWDDFRFIPGAIEAVRSMNSARLRVIAITNQRGVARGIMTIEDLDHLHRRMNDELLAAGAHLDAIYYCPHADNSCDCRKPKVGLFLQAQSDFPDIAFPETYVVGDSDRDMEAGRRLGARLIRIGPGDRPEEYACGSLAEAADYILAPNRRPCQSR